MRRSSGWAILSVAGVVVWFAGCSARAVPSLPAVLAHPEFVYPIVPQALASLDASGRIDRGWRFLQNDDTVSAAREFQAAFDAAPAFYPAQAGSAYVAMARRDHERALELFDAALRTSAAYVPALIGRGQTLLLLERRAAALEAYEAALAADGSLVEVRRIVDGLRFRAMQDLIESARGAASAGRVEDARAAYVRALEISPDSAFLYRELGVLERRRGDVPAALERFRQAERLDPGDAVSAIQTGEILEQQRDYVGAEAAYRRAADIEPSADLTARIGLVSSRSRESRLPAEFQAIASADVITRGDLAALVGVRLEDILRTNAVATVVMTDIRGHWASSWIEQAARTGVLEPFANHTFQPGARVTRADLARTVNRVVRLLATERPALRAHLTARPRIADMTDGHLSYPDVSVSVSSGVIPLVDGRFDATRPVSGAEAVDVVARLRALADSR
jgi:tetratricopeptide (TPR) repeat protein